MDEQAKMAHLARAKENYDNPETDTPGSFEEYFAGQYVDEYGAESKKQDPNSKKIDQYMAMLAKTREGESQEQPGLLSKVQNAQKGPYPMNKKEDDHLLQQILKFVYHDDIRKSIFQLLKSSPENLAQKISETAANLAAKLVIEMRKLRPVNEATEAVVIRIAIEELWTIARNMGLKKVPPRAVQGSFIMARKMFDQIEEQMGTRTAQQPQQIEQLQGGI